MVIVVKDKTPLWAALAITTLVLVVVGLLLFLLIGRGQGTVFVVAIPGFPVESIVLGLVVGLLLVASRRRRRR